MRSSLRFALALGSAALTSWACSDSTGPGAGDGSRLIFRSNLDGQGMNFGRPLLDLYTMESDGSNVERLTHAPNSNLEFTLSPDGTRLVYNDDDCQLVMLDGSGAQVLTSREVQGGCSIKAVWSPDGSRIAFATHREGRQHGITSGYYDVYVMNADGTDQHNVSHELVVDWPVDHSPAGWTPDGRVLIQVPGRLFVVAVDGVGAEPFLEENDASPRWSPDGSKVAFVRQSVLLQIQQGVLHVANADGSDAQPLTDYEVHLPVAGRDPWSPDGSRLAFSRVTPEPEGGVYIINANGSSPRQLSFMHPTDSYFSSWSDDGVWIYFDSGGDISRIRPDGSGGLNLTNSVFVDMDAVWRSPR